MLALAAERAIERIFGVAFGLGHRFSPFRPLQAKRVVKRLTKQPNQTTLTKRSLRPLPSRLRPPSARGHLRQPGIWTSNHQITRKIKATLQKSSPPSAKVGSTRGSAGPRG